jgi:hypothetical protein
MENMLTLSEFCSARNNFNIKFFFLIFLFFQALNIEAKGNSALSCDKAAYINNGALYVKGNLELFRSNINFRETDSCNLPYILCSKNFNKVNSSQQFQKVSLTDYGVYLLDDKGDLFSWSYDLISSSGLLNNSKRKQVTNGGLIKSPVKFTEISSGSDSLLLLDEFSGLWGMLDLSYYSGDVSTKEKSPVFSRPVYLNINEVADIFSDKYAHLILKKNGDVFIFGKVKNLDEILIIDHPTYIAKLAKDERIIGFNADIGFLVADSFYKVKLNSLVEVSSIKQNNFTKDFFLKLDGVSLKNLSSEMYPKYLHKPSSKYIYPLNPSKKIKIEGGVDFLLIQIDNKIFINGNNLFIHNKDSFEVN